MTRTIRCVVLVGVVSLLQTGVSFAEGDWWDHASGPGPFLGFFFDYRFACINSGTGGPVVTWLRPRDRTATPSLWKKPVDSTAPAATDRAAVARYGCTTDTKVPHFLTLTFRWDHSYRNDLVPSKNDPKCKDNDCDPLRTVRATALGVGYFKRVGGGVAVGAVPGFTRFSGPAFTPIWRLSVTPTIQYSPLVTKDDGTDQNGRWFTLVAAVTIMDGLHRSDFCNRPQFACSVLNAWPGSDVERMVRFGFIFDPSLRR